VHVYGIWSIKIQNLKYVILKPPAKARSICYGVRADIAGFGEFLQTLAVDTRVKVIGLAKAAQYNGQSGVVKGFDQESGRYMVLLKNGKELKIKRDNMENLDGAVKGGFLAAQSAKASSKGPAVLRPTGKKEGVLDGYVICNMKYEI
jgi:hypothetical protein